jgi:hypothetical protein
VIPVLNEYKIIPKTLPTYYRIKPDELLLCMDSPPHLKTYLIAKKISSRFPEIDTRIIFVERNPEYTLHQAWVRRKGFMEAKNDTILTGDIDLIVNSNVLKAVKLVGNNDIGLVSCSKFYLPKDIKGIYRGIISRALSKFVYPIWKKRNYSAPVQGNFTGLYALYRPFWIDSESDGIKNLNNPKQELRIDRSPVTRAYVAIGEDTYLRDCLERKHKVMYLKDLGAIAIRPQFGHHPNVQFEFGRYYYHKGRNFIGALLRATIYLRPHELRGFLFEKQRHN